MKITVSDKYLSFLKDMGEDITNNSVVQDYVSDVLNNHMKSWEDLDEEEKEHSYEDEIKFILKLLEEKGVKPIAVDDGEGFEPVETYDNMFQGITGVDWSNIRLEYNGSKFTVAIILGNDAGEAISDWSFPNKEIDNLMGVVLDELEEKYN